MGNHTTASDGGLDQGIELLVAADGELEVTGSDSLHLEILAGVSGKLEYLSGEILEDSGSVDGGCSADAAARCHSALEESVDSAHRELKK